MKMSKRRHQRSSRTTHGYKSATVGPKAAVKALTPDRQLKNSLQEGPQREMREHHTQAVTRRASVRNHLFEAEVEPPANPSALAESTAHSQPKYLFQNASVVEHFGSALSYFSSWDFDCFQVSCTERVLHLSPEDCADAGLFAAWRSAPYGKAL